MNMTNKREASICCVLNLQYASVECFNICIFGIFCFTGAGDDAVSHGVKSQDRQRRQLAIVGLVPDPWLGSCRYC